MIENAIKYVKQIFADDCSGHDYHHTMRVYRLAVQIAKQENADMLIVQLAALLHDVDDAKLSPETYATKKNAIDFMESNGVDNKIIETVCKIIEEVSFVGNDSVVPSTIEAKCVQDADRLNAMGAIGIARTFAYGGSNGRMIYDPEIKPLVNMSKEDYRQNQNATSINHFYEKLLLLKDMMNTETAKRMAEHRQAVMEAYLEEFMACGKENGDMLEVKFYDTVDDALLKFAVIISQSNGKWVLCKHKERDTYEVPGGHREDGEDILDTAKRELQEETGAVKFDIEPLCVYSVTGKTSVNENGEESFGLLCFAEIIEFSGRLESEIEKVELMEELPQNWTYPLIQPKLIERYQQAEKQSYIQIQQAAKQTIDYIKNIIKPKMNLLEIRKLCEEKLLELGADSFWYWDVGAFVFAGDETTVSVSGKQYVTADRHINNNDIITIDLSPQRGNIWGDYARTVILENGKVVDDIELIENQEWKRGLQMEERLHTELLSFVTKETTFEELYYHMNEFIVKNGFVNLDFMGNMGHSIVKAKGDRIYIEKGNETKLGEVKYFTFEPHIAFPDSKYGYKKENIYYFDGDRLVEL